MKCVDCESVRFSAMAQQDGETGPLTAEEVERHVGSCKECQAELSDLSRIRNVLEGCSRREVVMQIWPSLEPRLSKSPRWHIEVGLLCILSALLFVYRLADLAFVPEAWLSLKVVPLLLAAALFLCLRQNPFRLNPGLASNGAGE